MLKLESMAIILLISPILTSLLIGLNTRRIRSSISQIITCLGMVVSFVCSLAIFYSLIIKDAPTIHITIAQWLKIGDLKSSWAIYVDSLTAYMYLIVTTISLLVHLYSIGYMKNDPHKQRFMAYLSLFTFFMLTLVSADNFVQLFFGWEGVGLSSYLLIGFWFKKKEANLAAFKAFIVNRVGDIGLALGIFMIFYVFNSVEYHSVFSKASSFEGNTIHLFGNDFDVLNAIGLLIFIGCMGKSAQLGLHTWLPDAMEGPTPVSALIHAATMVTAGVFLIVRCSPLFEHAAFALQIITIIGALTCSFAAIIAITQTDIKKIIAYSTCSQLGYMFFACGVSAYDAAMFHLGTHAFFKSLLFLSAGSVIHASQGEQNIWKLGGLWNKIPFTYLMMWIGFLALAGIIPFSGYYSKDAILKAAFNSHTNVGMVAYILGSFGALCTAFYSWRLLSIVFHGKCNLELSIKQSLHESPLIMLLPLTILSVGALAGGWYGYSELGILNNNVFWKGSIYSLKNYDMSQPYALEYMPLSLGLLGIALAYFIYLFASNNRYYEKLATAHPKLYNFMKYKGYFDEIYNKAIVKNLICLSNGLTKYMEAALDSIPNGFAALSLGISKLISKFQSGYLYHYISVMIISLLIILIIALNGLWLVS